MLWHSGRSGKKPPSQHRECAVAIATPSTCFEQEHSLIDNAGVVQVFCPRNLHVAPDFASVIGEISADQVIGMSADQPLLRIEEEVRSPQAGTLLQ